jgi:UDP-N-acetylglucosamine 2-epimerase (non-hydrolysing)
MLAAIEDVLVADRPDWVLVYGDTNSTLAATVAAVKLHIPTAHLEAGLRSFNRAMPEEINRVLTDHASDLLLVPTDTAWANLQSEGLAARSVMVGDVMADLCLGLAAPDDRPAGEEPYVVATIHRPSNTDDPGQLARIVAALADIPGRVLLLAHPRLVAAAGRIGLELETGAIELMSPQPYVETMRLVQGASGVVTDSGGLQKEAFLLGTPCLTVRAETEWLETLVDGWNVLDPTAGSVVESAIRDRPSQVRSTPFGDGHAAEKVVAALRQRGASDASQSANSA